MKFDIFKMPKPLSAEAPYFENERDNDGPSLPLVRDVDVPRLLEYFNNEAKKVALSSNTIFLDVNNKEFSDEDFRDNGHFSPKGANKLSKTIYPSIEKLCK